jgi:predicted porin
MAIDHLGGEAAHDRSYTTAALNFDYQAWNLGASYTHIKNDAEESDESHNGHIQQISLGYTFANGVGFGVGYKRADEDNEVNDRVGARLTYSVDF